MQKPILILYYDTQWNTPLPRYQLPRGFEITADRSRYAEAQVVLFAHSRMEMEAAFFVSAQAYGQLWVAWSMECEENYPRLKDPNFIRAFDGTMTYRLDSDLPVIYFGVYGPIEEALAELVMPLTVKNAPVPAVSFISSRINHSKRREYARELVRYLETDSYGNFLNNVHGKKDRGRPYKLKTIARYKFTLAFENAIARDYVTEKFYDPLSVGSLPIYLGAPNVDDFAPGDHCFVNVNDYAGPQALAEYLHSLLHDEAAYDASFEWKNKPLRPAFLELLAPFRRPVLLRTCDWLEQKMD